MNPPDAPDPKAELLELCDRLLDGDFTAADRERLEALVLGDSILRRLYVERLHLHATLKQSAAQLKDVPLAEALRVLPDVAPASAKPRRTWAAWRMPLQIAAALMLVAILWWTLRPIPFATLAETKGARWESSTLPTEPGSSLGAGRLRLAEGIARVVFRSGAEVSLEGPAELELTGTNACYLHSGALVAHVPVPAHGFVVATANARLVDHGTDFGISSDAAGQAQVQVLQGEVELQHGRSGQTMRLTTKESAAITADKLASGSKGEGEPDRYAFTRGAERKPVMSLTTASGAGDAGYTVSPGTKIHFSDTLLLVKNAPTASYLRRAYLRFDLAPLRDRKVIEASLTLNFAPTGFGYASLTGDCTFAVYGVTDDAQDGWSADTLTWENAPAFVPDAGSVDTSRAMKLGTFTLPRGVVSGAWSIGGPALAEFLNHDANRKATLVVVRETSEPGNGSAVHGFAGNRHPELAPPTLRLTLAQGK